MSLKQCLSVSVALMPLAVFGQQLPPLRVNGVSIQITRIAGEQVAARTQAIEAGWRQVANDVGPWREEGGWRVLSRRLGNWSEVLQIRQIGTQSEAYLSRLDLTQKPGAVPVLPLPPGCRINSTVESTDLDARVVQATGPCAGIEAPALAEWAKRLATQGWSGGQAAGGGLWQFQRGHDVLQVLRQSRWVTALLKTAREARP